MADDDRFQSIHSAYVASSTVQWAAGLVYVWCAVSAVGAWGGVGVEQRGRIG